jgi:hypothetical protein
MLFIKVVLELGMLPKVLFIKDRCNLGLPLYEEAALPLYEEASELSHTCCDYVIKKYLFVG